MVSLTRPVDGLISDMLIRAKKRQYLTDPAKWAKDILNIDLWTKQREIGQSIVKNKNTAVAAGHGVGKSFSTAVFISWWIDVHPIDEVYVASTAPTLDQVGGIIWREIRRCHAIAEQRHEEYLRRISEGIPLGEYEHNDHTLPGYITGDNKWKTARGEILGQGRKPPDQKEESAFQGFHDGYVLAVGDEACGLSGEMIDSLSNITTNENSRRLLIGNPTNPASAMGELFRNPTGAWNLMHISVFDSPNFHGGGVCDCPEHKNMPFGEGLDPKALGKLSDMSYVEDKIKEYGKDSARYRSRVLGQFAYDSGNTLFTEKDIANGVNAQVQPSLEPEIHLGVDVARFGPDWTYVYKAEWGEAWSTDGDGEFTESKGERGVQVRLASFWNNTPITGEADDWDKMGTAERVDVLARRYQAKSVRVDASGMGGGVIDRLVQLSGGDYVIIEMMGGGPSPDRRQWLNNRAYQIDTLRKRMGEGLVDIDGTDAKLTEELLGIIYEFADGSSGGGLKIESKESMKKRKAKSPDRADAVWYAATEIRDLSGDLEEGTVLGPDFDSMDDSLYAWDWG